MAATFTVSNIVRSRDMNRRVIECDVALSGTYTTGGDSLSPALFSLTHIDDLTVAAGPNAAAHGRQVVLAGTPNAPKLKQFNGSTAEVASGAALSGTVRLRVKGR